MIKSVFLAAAIAFTSPSMPPEYAKITWEETEDSDIDPELVAAIMWTESRYRPRARNLRTRTIGLMQIAPFWSHHFRIRRRRLFEPRVNIRTAVRILEINESAHASRCRRRFGRRYRRHHDILSHYRCSRNGFRSRACRRSVRSVRYWEERLKDHAAEIEEERRETPDVERTRRENSKTVASSNP